MKSKQTSLLFFALINLFSFNKVTAQKSNYSKLIVKCADKIEQKIIAWRHDIHQNPELGNQELLLFDYVEMNKK